MRHLRTLDEHKYGVGFVSWCPDNIHILVCGPDETSEVFIYNSVVRMNFFFCTTSKNILQTEIDNTDKSDQLLVMGDFNSKVGRIVDSNEKGVVGNFGLGERNDCGERLVEFAIENEMAITNTMFMNHKRRLYTWTSPDGDTKNQIDYILVNRRWRTSELNTERHKNM